MLHACLWISSTHLIAIIKTSCMGAAQNRLLLVINLKSLSIEKKKNSNQWKKQSPKCEVAQWDGNIKPQKDQQVK